MKNDSLQPIRCTVLKKLRKDNKKTQGEMAEFLGVTEKTYRSWEKGEYRKDEGMVYPEPGLNKIIEIAENFNCSVDYVLGRSECKSVDNDYISKQTGLSDNSINELRKFKSFNDEPTLFVINEILSKNEKLLNAITDYIFFPDNIQTDYHLETQTGKILPKEKFVIPIKGTSMSMCIESHNIPLNSDTLRNALLNSIQENMILFKKSYIVGEKIDNKQSVIIKAPDTN